MSSIIKSQKIRSESIIDFSSRIVIESNNAIASEIESDEIEQFNEVDLTVDSSDNEEKVEYLEEKFRTKEEIQKYKRKQLHEIQELIDLKLREADEQISRKYAELVLKTKNEEEEIDNVKKAVLFEAEVEKQKILSDALVEAESIKQEAINEKNELLASTEDEMVNTISYLVENIISNELKYNTRWLKLLVKKMIHKDNLVGDIIIRVSPVLYEKLTEEQLNQIKSLKDGVEIIQDELVDETMCIVACEQGTIQYDVNEGLQRVLQDIRILLESK